MGKLMDSRLLAVAEMVRPGSVVADIGADHGHLICHLVKEGTAIKGYACDIGQKPLDACARTVARCGLGNKIELCLNDGLQGLPIEEIDDIIIAGMGGELIADIIKAAPGARDELLRFILQPMTKAERLRACLYQMGYAIQRERAVQSGEFLYTVVSVCYTGQCKDVDEFFTWVGLLPQDNSPQNRKLLALTAQRLAKIADGLARTSQGREKADRYNKFAHDIDKILQKEG